MIPGLDHLPAWAADAALGLLRAVFSLALAKDDAGREEALMQAAEDAKRALDKRKFGG